MNFGFIPDIFALAIGGEGTFAPLSAEAWSYAGRMTLLGMGLVFSVLVVLMLVLNLFKLVFARPEKKKKTKAKASVPSAISSVIEESAQSFEEVNASSNDAEELVAIITAAVSAYRDAEGLGGTGFRVVSFKRAGGNHWNSKK
jgi:sodium pump decarboxylase gamma subunit